MWAAALQACHSGPNSSGPGSGNRAGWNAQTPGAMVSFIPQRRQMRVSWLKLAHTAPTSVPAAVLGSTVWHTRLSQV